MFFRGSVGNISCSAYNFRNSKLRKYIFTKIKFPSFGWERGGGERKCNVSPDERQRDKRIVIIELRSRVRFIEKKAYLSRDHNYLPERGDDLQFLLRKKEMIRNDSNNK